MSAISFGDLINADFGVPTAPSFNQPYLFPSATSAGPGGFDWGKLLGMNMLSNFGLNAMSQANTASSLGSTFNTAGIMNDINMGRDLYALNKDIMEQKKGIAWGEKFKADNPNYRQNQLASRLSGVAGRWGAFLAG